MFEQTFSLYDLPLVLILAFLEILLSADNAVILALLVRSLPKRQQGKVLYMGFVSAFLLRALALLTLTYLIHFLWFQLIGALYLLYLSIRYWTHKQANKTGKTGRITRSTLYTTVLKIELFDLLFAMDSLLAGVAFITSSTPDSTTVSSKLWIVYLGGMIGALTIRYAASLFTYLITRFPRLEAAAHAMIGWMGLKLALIALSLTFPYFSLIFWLFLCILLAVGLTKRGQPLKK